MTKQMHRRSRRIEYLKEEYLLKQTGITKSQLQVYALKELLDNGIDADEDNNIQPIIKINIKYKNKTFILSVENETPFPEEEIDNILDLDNYYGTKHYRKYLKRGAQGNALKTLIGWCSTQNNLVELHTGNNIHKLGFKISELDVESIHEIIQTDKIIKGTKVLIKLNIDEDFLLSSLTLSLLNYIMCNPNVIFKIKLDGKKINNDCVGNIQKYKGKDNIYFYTEENFKDLIIAEKDIFKRTKKRLSIINFCKRFDSLSSNRLTSALLKNIGVKWIDELEEKNYQKLYNNMLALSRRIKPKKLGKIGKEQFKKRVEEIYEIKIKDDDIKYKYVANDGDKIPFILEGFCVFHEKIEERRIIFCINNTITYDLPTLEDLEIQGYYCSDLEDALNIYDVEYDSPACIIFHLYSPNIIFRDYGKSDFVIGDNEAFNEGMKKIIYCLFNSYCKEKKRKHRNDGRIREDMRKNQKARERAEEEREKSEMYESPKNEEDYELQELFNASEGQLRYWFKPTQSNQLCNKKALMRATLIAQSKDCRNKKLEAVPLRSRTWYGAVKPILSRADPIALTKEGSKWDGKTSNILSDLVEEGKVSYDDYKVFDTSRQKRLSSVVYDEIIIFVEKNGMYPIIKKVADVYDIKVMSGGGYSGGLATWELVKYIKYNEDKDKKYFVILLTDLDPHGFRIYREFTEKITWMMERIGRFNVDYERIGINQEHISEQELEISKYRLKKDKNMTIEEFDNWCSEYGIMGEDGNYYGLEIEAITEPEKLRKILVNKLKELCKAEEMYKHFMEEQIENLPEDVANDILEQLKEVIVNAGKEILEWWNKQKDKEFDERELPEEELLPNTAIEGDDLIIDNEDNEDKLKKKVISKFKRKGLDIKTIINKLNKNRKK